MLAYLTYLRPSPLPLTSIGPARLPDFDYSTLSCSLTTNAANAHLVGWIAESHIRCNPTAAAWNANVMRVSFQPRVRSIPVGTVDERGIYPLSTRSGPNASHHGEDAFEAGLIYVRRTPELGLSRRRRPRFEAVPLSAERKGRWWENYICVYIGHG